MNIRYIVLFLLLLVRVDAVSLEFDAQLEAGIARCWVAERDMGYALEWNAVWWIIDSEGKSSSWKRPSYVKALTYKEVNRLLYLLHPLQKKTPPETELTRGGADGVYNARIYRQEQELEFVSLQSTEIRVEVEKIIGLLDFMKQSLE